MLQSLFSGVADEDIIIQKKEVLMAIDVAAETEANIQDFC